MEVSASFAWGIEQDVKLRGLIRCAVLRPTCVFNKTGKIFQEEKRILWGTSDGNGSG